ncbi:aminotransferase class V-fold PLP-dependent enzyme [uncultured Paludibaculum sp.]|uniref:aminotransferase class V-fold PLP-dependent enzyme n=1 Tax=uncultured Paludibaculum sp. TaxID=1765020 RepID=UPI002AAA99CE|nr:aminotransferase class V-fold PLP-dependent enzyme [uncultured Paludibaculum sp.]
MDRRRFVSSTVGALAVLQHDSVARAQSAVGAVSGRPADSVARDEDFWLNIRHAFTVDRNLINLNNGGVSPSPRMVMDTEKRYLEVENMSPSYYMWNVLDPGIETVRRRLAETFGCDPEEIAITRNASESLEIVQLGMDLKAGDEVLTTNQDYPRMITTWKQRERRDGIVLKQITFPVPPPSLDYLAHRIEENITPKTKVIHICHITNRTGQIFPVKKICQMARARGIEVVVDGAHAFAQFPFKHEDLDCDYYGTSLHKWVLAPIGTGMLYVRKSKIPKIWPMMAAPDQMVDNIRKFEEIGTHPASQRNAITEALTFHDSIGGERKAERLRYLRRRWSNRLRELPGVKILNSDDPEQSCGIGFIQVDGLDAPALAKYLMDKYRIWTVAIVTPGEYQGLRITPNVYTTLEEVDTFASVMEKVIRKGSIPA